MFSFRRITTKFAIAAAACGSCGHASAWMTPRTPNIKDDVVIIAGTGNKKLAHSIADKLGITPIRMKLKRFSDGEVSCRAMDSMRGKDVFIIQPCAAPVNDNMMELLLMISCAKRCGAMRVTAVVPYFGYKYHRRGEPISTKNQSRFLWSAAGDFSKMMNVMGVDRVLAVDLHRPGQGQETCFFDTTIPVETASSSDLSIKYIKDNVKLNEKVTIVAASPDFIKKARKYQIGLQDAPGVKEVSIAAFLRRSDDSNVKTSRNVTRLLGDVTGSDVIIVDDVVDTAGTLSTICHRLVMEGANKVYICASHGLFTEKSMELIGLSPVEKVIVTDSLPLPPDASDKVVQVSIAPKLAELIEEEYSASLASRTCQDDDVYESE
mmetsp:Transcript_15399/g.23211  ORF Transcript_15399/g.23211 Transcript_15399/m.23211 type:complete len:378 (+) Transcript_15399:90-1223(+)|eukprot:CAMPEP_0185033726 /NCGR_PEP_ID=MMETSP1103-20130426/22973_1 /TAXON_ID=36769 /ORGANISM="Paraphysomonas bandaiensis, Strain Caron Lab Isolate" /LENGTH=377 /DNA_ID=CAMNT_0027570107 /DNA_START=72 /DNA_END=1205 /DNA_ORIENTATION=+